MKKSLAVFPAMLALCASLAQAEPPTEASISALLDATQADRMVETMLTQVQQQMQRSMANAAKSPNVNEAQKHVLEAMPDKMIAVLREELAPAKMRALQVQVYQEVFTQEEVEALTAFYRSPTGAAMINKMPLVMQRSMALMQQRMQPVMQRMQAETMEALEKLKATK
ncbi:MAG TPA: DUF2059 domain-containing protein [Burkholderiaceae bacterium]